MGFIRRHIRTAGKDDNILFNPPVKLTLEYAVEFIADGELVEVTPAALRLRMPDLREHERRRDARDKLAAAS